MSEREAGPAIGRTARRLAWTALAAVLGLACAGPEPEAVEAGALVVQAAAPAGEAAPAAVVVTLDGGTPGEQVAEASAVEPGLYAAAFPEVDARSGAVHGVTVEAFGAPLAGPALRGAVGGVQVSPGLATQVAVVMGPAAGGPGPAIGGVTSSRRWLEANEVAVLSVAAPEAGASTTYAWADDCGGSFQALDDAGGAVVWAPGPAAAGACRLGVTAAEAMSSKAMTSEALITGATASRALAAAPTATSTATAAIGLSIEACSPACDPRRRGLVTMGPASMGGELRLAPGAVLRAGYDFMVPGPHPAAWYAFTNPQVAFSYACDSGSAAGKTILVAMQPAVQTYQVSAGGEAWAPSGDPGSPLAYQGTYRIGQECRGGKVRILRGLFSATLASTARDTQVAVRWHYGAAGGPGPWSAPQAFDPGCVPLAAGLTVQGFVVSPPQVARLAIQHDAGTCLVDLTGTVSRCAGTFRAGRRYAVEALWYRPAGPAVVVKASLAATCDGPGGAPVTRTIDLGASPQRALFDWTAPAVPAGLSVGLACRLALTVTFSDGGARSTATTVPVAFRVAP